MCQKRVVESNLAVRTIEQGLKLSLNISLFFVTKPFLLVQFHSCSLPQITYILNTIHISHHARSQFLFVVHKISSVAKKLK